MKQPANFSLIFVLLLGIFLRLLFLDKFPVGFHSQEAIIGFRAFSIVNTARDELGRFLPILFTSFQDYQLPLSTYLLIPFIKFLRLNEFATRLPFAIFGILAIPALYGISRKLFTENKSIAIWSSFFLAVNPWSVFLSRTTSEVALSFHLFIAGFWALLVSDKKRWLLIVSLILFLTSLYSSKVAWFFVPAFIAVFLFVTSLKNLLIERVRFRLIFLITLIFLWLPLLFSYLTAPSVKQSLLLNDFSFFNDISILNSINQMRGETIIADTPFLGVLFFNKSFYLIRFVENFLVHFNPRFLFAAGSGGSLLGLTNFGPILLVFLPTTIFGIIRFLRRGDHRLMLILFWIFLAILPSAFLTPTLNQERLIFLLPPIALLSALGISQIRSKALLYLLILGLVFNLAFVIYDVAAKEPKRMQKDWLYGYKIVSASLKNQIPKYNKIYLTDNYARDPAPLLLFYFSSKTGKIVENYNKPQFGFRSWIDKVENIQIGKVPNLIIKGDEKILFAVTPEELNGLSSFKIFETVNDLNNKPLFLIGEFLKVDKNGNPIEK